MKVVIFGATGMVGFGALLESLDSDAVEEVLVVGRRSLGRDNPKLREILHEDFTDFSPLADELSGLDACFWCLGVSAAGLDEARYTEITYGYTMAAARVLLAQNPGMGVYFISGAGSDETGKARAMWARVKGKTENAILEMGFRDAVVFRPGFIRPKRGARLRGALYRTLYFVLFPFLPLFRLVGSGTSTVEVGRALIAAAQGKAEKPRLDSRDINRLAKTLVPAKAR